MEREMVRIEDIFSDLTALEKLILGGLANVFEPWYDVTDTGDVDEKKTCQRFEAWREQLPDQFPIMSRQDPRHGGMRHESAMDIGGIHCYGGLDSNFDHTARIKPPFLAGNHSTVRAGAYVNTSSVIGAHTTIGRRVDVSASFIRDHAQIDAFAMVNHSLIGRNVYIGPGVKLLHKPLRAKIIETIDSRGKGAPQWVATQRRKYGVAVGDGVIIDADAKICPGAVLLQGCVVPAGVIVPAEIFTKELMENRFGRARL